MKKGFKDLLLACSIGFTLGLLVWLSGIEDGWYAPPGLALGFGLFYLHMRWLRNVNKSKDGPKLKGLI
jgi:hypothetical protein